MLGETALPGYSWGEHNGPKLEALTEQLGLTADQAVDAVARSEGAQTRSGWVKHVPHHQRFLEGEVLQDGNTLRQLLIDKPAGAMHLLRASPAAVRAAAAYLRDYLGWSEEVLASRVLVDPLRLSYSVDTLDASMQFICNTFGVSAAAEAGELAERENRLLTFTPSTLKLAAEAVIEVMGSKEAAW